MRCARVTGMVVLVGAILGAFGALPTLGQGQKLLLTRLTVEKPRTYKSMVVFPIRYDGRQAPGHWETMDKAVETGHLRILEKEQATVARVRMENVSDGTIFLMSGEIIKGGKQTRVIRKDTVIEPRQKVTVPVFCVEKHRWRGTDNFKISRSQAPASINAAIKRGAGQKQVWSRVEEQGRKLGVQSATGSLDEILSSDTAKKEFEALHEGLGKFSPSDTIGIAVADARTGRVIGLELFGRRDLFENLQDKLVEGYAADLILARKAGADSRKVITVKEKQVMEFIRRSLSGTSKYENTPGSGRGIDLSSGALRGKGVGLAEAVIHLSIQQTRQIVTPAKPVVNDRTEPLPMPPAGPPRVR